MLSCNEEHVVQGADFEMWDIAGAHNRARRRQRDILLIVSGLTFVVFVALAGVFA